MIHMKDSFFNDDLLRAPVEYDRFILEASELSPLELFDNCISSPDVPKEDSSSVFSYVSTDFMGTSYTISS